MCKKIKILILSHDKFGQELYNTAKMMVGEMEEIYYFNFLKTMSFEELESKVKDFIKKNKKSEILIFTDIFGGSCSNICTSILNKFNNVKIFSGVNLGLLLEAIFLRNSCNLEQLADILDKKKFDTIVYINKKLDLKGDI